jgi:RnfABCDGE-type electron transport complex G subunit
MKITLHMLATLILIGMFAGGALSLVNDWADPLIAENQRRARDEAISFLVPGGTPEQVVDQDGLTAWRVAGEDGEVLGWVVRHAGVGFQAEIDLMIALSPDRQEIRGLKVIADSETPGLGTWIRLQPQHEQAMAGQPERYLADAVGDPKNFPLQFFAYDTGKHLSAMGDLKVVKGTPRDRLGPDEVQAITAATISAQAVVDIVNEAVTLLDEALAAEGGVS